ncbi:putative HD phosphohydrolase [Moumouvirus australiensis]|uniref:Putative HD phosphohydrolase n=1 Tax=Moumouvirus australiensis TaxID=2109587 RepID=A0A2P1ELL5_9VIRU|nr:putative HD phosphohydrolase [Moumouvirus australiensis]AVL94770.1 putative HD phosphohydrolase [Moumouvirus australiensis]
MDIERTVDHIIDLYNKYGASDYIGENLTQLEHMTKAAMLAEEYGETETIILACFLHDIGHLIEINNESIKMDNLGVLNHESIGREYLLNHGFSEELANLVGNHVKSKRYLVTKFPDYINKLSDASRQTLKYQNNYMSVDEMTEFENDLSFTDSLKIRFYDDQSKIVTRELKSLDYYRRLMINHLKNNC